MGKVFQIGEIKASNPDYNVTVKEVNKAVEKYQQDYHNFDEEIKEWSTLDKMFKNEKIADVSTESKIVYRGVCFIEDTNPLLQEGNIVPCNNKFISTSKSRNVAMHFAADKIGANGHFANTSYSNYLMEIELPENTRYLDLSKINKAYKSITKFNPTGGFDTFDKEVLLSRLGSFEVLSVDKFKGIIQLRYIQK